MKALESEIVALQESVEIRKCAVAFYEKLFKKERPEVVFYEGLPKVFEATNAELDTQTSADELRSALQSLETGKTPF